MLQLAWVEEMFSAGIDGMTAAETTMSAMLSLSSKELRRYDSWASGILFVVVVVVVALDVAPEKPCRSGTIQKAARDHIHTNDPIDSRMVIYG